MGYFIIFSIFILYLILASASHSASTNRKPEIHICDQGMDGHNERVANFYGFDSYKDMLKADGIDIDEIERKVESGEIKVTTLNMGDYAKRNKS